MNHTLPDRMGDVHDFDFLSGRWTVHNRRLMTRLIGANDWTDFPASMGCEPRFGGAANIDQIDFPTLGFSGLTLRLFDPARRRWAIYWVNSRDGLMTPPVHGGFEGDRGEFYGIDEDGGREVDVRFVWTRLDKDRAQWEQSFRLKDAAEDEWETNWVMQLNRLR
ncbi:hypothetical protein [Aquabacterium sp.]|uniref:hypothetical protein n=1 Tax=Aquabacterium sp. TaxID=1872578 RepID=UPI002CB6DE35|nr:hypothetical protein [Aquabacterium sp.]HSW05839.1 hypothetical protein [Aquabacterium sp.]